MGSDESDEHEPLTPDLPPPEEGPELDLAPEPEEVGRAAGKGAERDRGPDEDAEPPEPPD
ncbi:hypothetical protein LHJ74_17275 [Streptomyces sp. N2-109]|uniref:Uncharacterized protein n=1 Tax=Streptomyces gossypii TaxID=2883101 RepID=A0ABT2JUQ8_9ACTN|nr:hypothetical protein [Streptomyces gossypii]MCT2591628.1 hypothetical protein [Streptomyces gossypii]